MHWMMGREAGLSPCRLDGAVQLRNVRLNSELADYRTVPQLPLEADPLSFWRENESRFPNIAKLARKYLAIPASSAPSERVFSYAKLIQNRQRWSLTPMHLEQAIFLKQNGRILAKDWF